MIKLVNGEYIETEEMQYEDPAPVPNDTQRVETLVKGLSTATTIAQIRSVAKQILDETGGDGE